LRGGGDPGFVELNAFLDQGGHTETYRGTEYHVDFIPKVRIEVLVATELAERVVDAIVESTRTERIGDGKVWVTAVNSVVRIRTGEAGSEAL